MSKEEFKKIQTCVLKVHIHCDGCKHKVKKILKKIDGVQSVDIDSDQEKVTVSGIFEPATIIEKLNKNGKYAELWNAPKANNNNLINQFKNLQINYGKGGNNKGQGQKGQNQPKGGGRQGQNPQLQHLQQLKALQDMKMLPRFTDTPLNNDKGHNPKSVKFNVPEDDGLSNDEFDDDDDEDDYDDDDAPKMKPVTSNGHGGGSMMAKMINNMMMNGKKLINFGNNGGKAKKGKGGASGGNIPVQMNLSGGANGGKKGGSGNNNQNQGGGKARKKSGGPPQDGKNSGSNGGHRKNGGGGAKKAGGMKNGGPHGLPNMMAMNGGGVSHMGNMPMGGPMGQMSNLASVQGLPSGVGGVPEHMEVNPYYQQQLSAMMMNQQRGNGNERFQPMMYGQPPPAVNYMPPYYAPYSYPLPPGEQVDQYAMFNDENTSSCNIM